MTSLTLTTEIFVEVNRDWSFIVLPQAPKLGLPQPQGAPGARQVQRGRQGGSTANGARRRTPTVERRFAAPHTCANVGKAFACFPLPAEAHFRATLLVSFY